MAEAVIRVTQEDADATNRESFASVQNMPSLGTLAFGMTADAFKEAALVLEQGIACQPLYEMTEQVDGDALRGSLLACAQEMPSLSEPWPVVKTGEAESLTAAIEGLGAQVDGDALKGSLLACAQEMPSLSEPWPVVKTGEAESLMAAIEGLGAEVDGDALRGSLLACAQEMPSLSEPWPVVKTGEAESLMAAIEGLGAEVDGDALRGSLLACAQEMPSLSEPWPVVKTGEAESLMAAIEGLGAEVDGDALRGSLLACAQEMPSLSEPWPVVKTGEAESLMAAIEGLGAEVDGATLEVAKGSMDSLYQLSAWETVAWKKMRSEGFDQLASNLRVIKRPFRELPLLPPSDSLADNIALEPAPLAGPESGVAWRGNAGPIAVKRPPHLLFPDCPSDLSFPDLLAIYSVHGSPELGDKMKQAIEAGDHAEAFKLLSECREETRVAWATSESGRTYARCASRWKERGIPPTFPEALTIIRPVLRAASSVNRTAKDAGHDRARYWFFNGRDERELRLLMVRSRGNASAWDAVDLIDERLRGAKEHPWSDISSALTRWCLDRLEGRTRRPLLRRGRRSVSFRNFVICLVIRELKSLGMKPTRNDANGDRGSACDVVAEALFLSYHTIKVIWHGFREKESIDAFEPLDGGEFDASVPGTASFFLMRHLLTDGRL